MQEQANTQRGILLLMLLVPLFWGGAFGSGKHVLTELPPFTTATIRYGLAGLLLMIWLTAQRGWDWQIIRERWKGLLLLSVTGIFCYNAFFFLGLQYTSSTNGALVVAMNPVSTTVLAVLFLKEAWSGRMGIGMVLSLLGVLTVISGGSLDVIASLSFNTGDLLLLGCVVTWSIYSTAAKVVMRGAPPLLVTTVTTVVGSCFLALGTLIEDGWAQVPQLSGQAMFELFYMAVFATVIANFIWNFGVHRLGASTASAYVNLVPINAMWMGVVFYGEHLHWAHAVGVVLVISGVLLTTRAAQKRAPLPPPMSENGLKA